MLDQEILLIPVFIYLFMAIFNFFSSPYYIEYEELSPEIEAHRKMMNDKYEQIGYYTEKDMNELDALYEKHRNK